jgi:hypothetical protein
MGNSSVFILQRLGDRSQLLGFLVMPIVGLYLGIMAQSLSQIVFGQSLSHDPWQ